MKTTINGLLLCAIILLFPQRVLCQSVSDYLILSSIGNYEFSTQGKDFVTGEIITIKGYSERTAPGDLISTGHFYPDHDDVTFETDYVNKILEIAVEVQVTQHPGADSDQWLLHEIEDSYRDGDDGDGRLGLVVDGTVLREFGVNRAFWVGIGGGHFRWRSNNVIIDISYTDFDGTKPEPLEIIQAYLQKFPSTLPADLVLNSDHDKQWIKDEMTRRFWLCDKWLAYGQTGGVAISELVRQLVDHLEVFLQYREKYFGVSAKTDLAELDGYKQAGNKAAIETKLVGYKTWWADHKTDSISLP